MKKTILLLMVLILGATAAFSSGWIGVDTGASIMWTDTKMEIEGFGSYPSVSSTEIDYYLGLTGAHYFNGSLGLGYSVSMLYPLSVKIDDSDFVDIEDPEIAVKLALSFQYQHGFSDSFSLEAGAGVYYNEISNSDAKYTTRQIGAEGNVGISFEVVSHLSLKAGAKILIPIHTWADTTGYGVSVDYDVSSYGVGVIPYAGIAFSY